mmetsp:Transcript_34147/g.89802  ORF Transcript_34147/g.89802 Transcript_34147/m.89802 type:complete len:134 (-) Transcript_34147:1109-1510(-)
MMHEPRHCGARSVNKANPVTMHGRPNSETRSCLGAHQLVIGTSAPSSSPPQPIPPFRLFGLGFEPLCVLDLSARAGDGNEWAPFESIALGAYNADLIGRRGRRNRLNCAGTDGKQLLAHSECDGALKLSDIEV